MRTARKTRLRVLLALAFGAAVGCDSDGDARRGRGMGGMREMMQQMMAGVVPSGVTPEALPDAESRGARLLARYCVQCHALPSPAMHTAEEWPPIVARMIGRMRMMDGKGPMMMRHEVRAPAPEEASTLVDYLRAHALRPAAPEALAEADLPGVLTFARVCSGCHAPPDPGLHAPDEWPAVVGRMRSHHVEMGRPDLVDREVDEIVTFLRRASAGIVPKPRSGGS